MFARTRRKKLPGLLLVIFIFSAALLSRAQEPPYFVTYDNSLEEPGNLEFETESTIGAPHSPAAGYIGHLFETEYGVKAWWTTELYLEGQSTRGDSTIFTGFRWEHRFRPLKREHFINPILYFEYENINEASKIKKEVVGNAEVSGGRNAELRREHDHELEGKLILASRIWDWNIAENFIVEKNLSQAEGLEFGYALGVWRPLSQIASGKECRLCRENFAAGMEMYGGLGTTQGFGLSQTAHYLAPTLSWQISENSRIRLSPGFGLTNPSDRMLLRVGYSYELRGFGQKVAAMFGGSQDRRATQREGVE